jgi:imidazoleglycerol-phosphate dehydratase / histidinol-phosphatase
MKKKLLFIDRDGTLILEPDDEQIDSLEKLEFYPGVFNALSRIKNSTEFKFVLVTNQDGLGTDSYPEETFWPAQDKMLKTFVNEGIEFLDIHIDRTYEHEKMETRKPGTGMLKKYFSSEYDLVNSYVIGDRVTDILLAKNLGSKGILLYSSERDEVPEIATKQLNESCALTTDSWSEIADFLISSPRTAEISRNTNETSISIKLNLDGNGKSQINTGLAFFDHMLEQLSRHGMVDLEIQVKGDLEVDEHHTIEDTAIVLGEAFNQALGSKKGLERYGFCLPMDDCLAQVAIDFGGRNWIEWEALFKREKIGEMPTEMFFHFFKSFSDSAKCNLNIKAEGQNEHHKIEAIFKAFAKAIKMGVRKDPANTRIPTTKGIL